MTVSPTYDTSREPRRGHRHIYKRRPAIYIFPVADLATELRGARRRLDLTQAQAAEVLATSQANISAYERGRLEPGDGVAQRIRTLATLDQTSLYRTYLASTIPSTAAQLRKDLAEQRSETDMLRVVIQASDDFAKLHSPADRTFFLCEPSPTGSKQWDALLAGLAVHLCRQAGMERTPLWTTNPALSLDHIWWFESASSLVRAYALKEAIPSMRARGVMMARRNLESV